MPWGFGRHGGWVLGKSTSVSIVYVSAPIAVFAVPRTVSVHKLPVALDDTDSKPNSDSKVSAPGCSLCWTKGKRCLLGFSTGVGRGMSASLCWCSIRESVERIATGGCHCRESWSGVGMFGWTPIRTMLGSHRHFGVSGGSWVYVPLSLWKLEVLSLRGSGRFHSVP